MSWNSTFIAINHDYSDRIDKLQADSGIVLGNPRQTISWEEATSSAVSGKSVGIVHGWTIICDPFMFLDVGDMESYDPGKMWMPRLEKGLEICSTGGQALGFILGGASDTYGMTFHDNGELRRCRLVQEGATLIDFGEPFPEEIEVFAKESDEEQRVFCLLEKFGLTYDKLDAERFTLYG